jgi:glutamate dehydrogenase
MTDLASPPPRNGRLLRAAARLRGGDLPDGFADFLTAYCAGLTDEDYETHGPRALVEAVLRHYEFGAQRRPGELRLRVTAAPTGGVGARTRIETVNDDMPHLVDTLTLTARAHRLAVHLTLHPVLDVRRDAAGRLRGLAADPGSEKTIRESWILLETDPVTDPERIARLEEDLRRNLEDARLVHDDEAAMHERLRALRADLARVPPPVPDEDRRETEDFLDWLDAGAFDLHGYRRYELRSEKDGTWLARLPGTGLGILRHEMGDTRRRLSPDVARRARLRQTVVVTKANAFATVHRRAVLDYIGLRRFDERGRVVGEDRFLGLFTTSALRTHPSEIPGARLKIRNVLERSGFAPESHAGRRLREILDTLPLAELLQASSGELTRLTRSVLAIQERDVTRLFLRRDVFGRYLSALVYLPRERYTARVRERIGETLQQGLDAREVESEIWLSGSNHARLHLTLRLAGPPPNRARQAELERAVQEAARNWSDELRALLLEEHGERTGADLYDRYAARMPAVYQDDVKPRAALYDILKMRTLGPERPVALSLYRPKHTPPPNLRFKLFHWDRALAISDTLPLLENLGFRVLAEHPYEIPLADGPRIWIHDFELVPEPADGIDPLESLAALEEAFLAVWNDRAENDGFNRLITRAGLGWRQTTLLRSIARYLVQTGVAFTPLTMERTLVAQPALARLLVVLFEARFDPDRDPETRAAETARLDAEIERGLEAVVSSDEDRVLRAFAAVVRAALRTNYYQTSFPERNFLCYKLDPSRLPDLPLPRPMFEIFVYAPEVEGVHLRAGRVARGGIRWSDRREDFRTEILGLMKAQVVKNTVIVPTGAKGGFYVKTITPGLDRETVLARGIEAYRIFIRGLLSLTDNVVDGRIVPPERTVRHDDDDPYLVVAADKGTASFSDIANALSAEYGFWLGDAFASGGSVGYDHKKMGITARGAWESVRMHFHDLGIDPDRDPFTAVGIGDMSGDVFGNGMLLSRKIRLLAAFNHQHIFIDPDPDPETSYAERRRLFDLPRSGWNDYDTALLSKGGGVYPRTAKQIRLSPEARAALGLEGPPVPLTPTEVIRAILKAPVDLFWNGGIGTYVKAAGESPLDVGDRSNDAVRVNGRELRARVVAEGGNLGLTQRGRVEYALHGGRLYTDFIDNSAGVDTSDHEVNIKILLSTAAERRRMSARERAKLLASMTDEVAELVLRDNFEQALALALANTYAPARFDEHVFLMRQLERQGLLQRQLEGLPTGDELAARRALGKGFTRPELAVLLSYSKIALVHEIVASDAVDDPYLARELVRYFPARLQRRYADDMPRHRLAREIVATALTNRMLNHMGPTFAVRMREETGASTGEIARAFAVAAALTEADALHDVLRGRGVATPLAVELELLHTNASVIRHMTRWFLHYHRNELDVNALLEHYADAFAGYRKGVGAFLPDEARARLDERASTLEKHEIPAPWARLLAGLPYWYRALDMIALARAHRKPWEEVARRHFLVERRLELDWVRERIETLPVAGHWQATARIGLREELYRQQRRLADALLAIEARDPDEAYERWAAERAGRLEHFARVLLDMKASSSVDYAALSVAVQELHKIA